MTQKQQLIPQRTTPIEKCEQEIIQPQVLARLMKDS